MSTVRNIHWPERYPDESQAEYRARRAASKSRQGLGFYVNQDGKHTNAHRNQRRKIIADVGFRQFKRSRMALKRRLAVQPGA